MTNRVNRFRVVDPHLGQPIDIDLPEWENVPESMRQEWRSLDQQDGQDDGIITYTPHLDTQNNPYQAVTHSGPFVNRLSRSLWAYESPFPFNNPVQDRATEHSRMISIQAFHRQVYEEAVLPLVQQNQWQEAIRILQTTANDLYFYHLGLEAKRQAELNRQDPQEYRFLLDVAEECYLNATRLDSRISWNYGRIPILERDFQQVNETLDTLDAREFSWDRQHPFLLATMGTPLTLEYQDMLSTGDHEIFVAVAVPEELTHGHSEREIQDNIRNYFNTTAQPRLRPSLFRSQRDSGEFRLVAGTVEHDESTPGDDRIQHQFSYHLNQERLNDVLFPGMTFYRVGFHFENDGELTRALDGREIRRFDLVLQRASSTPSIRPERIVEGSVVLQDMYHRPSTTVFAGDIHISERDYSIVAEMLASMTDAHIQDPSLQDRIERFYTSINENTLASVERWNEMYRQGSLHRVVIGGDLADFVNIASTLENSHYRSTNIRRLIWILSQSEAPIYVVSGNHDHHGRPFPQSVHSRNFVRDPSLRQYYAPLYDRHHFEGNLQWNGILGLLPQAFNNDSLPEIEEPRGFLRAIRQIYQTNIYGNRNDDFMDHMLQRLGIYENYGFSTGVYRFYGLQSGTEYFSYMDHLYNRAHSASGNAVDESFNQYVNGQEVSGLGPTPQEFASFINELWANQYRETPVINFSHYPVFADGAGPDHTPYASDSLRGVVALAFRLASWYFIYGVHNRPVLPLSIAFHVHHYREHSFGIHFNNPAQERQFNNQVEAIFRGINPLPPDTLETRIRAQQDEIRQSQQRGQPGYPQLKDPEIMGQIYDWVEDLHERWDGLDNFFEIQAVDTPGSDGFPGPILRRLATSAIDHPQPTTFVTAPALGPPSVEGNGYLLVTTHPNDDRIDTDLRLLSPRPDGNFRETSGSEWVSLEQEEQQRLHEWGLNPPDFHPPRNPTRIAVSKPHEPEHQGVFEWFPRYCQYPTVDHCINLRTGLDYNFTDQATAWSLDFEAIVPVTTRAHPIFGWNYLIVNAGLNTHGEFSLRLGVNTGFFSGLAVFRLNDLFQRQTTSVGVRLETNHQLPYWPFLLPNFWGEVTGDIFHSGVNWRMGLFWTIPIESLRRPYHGQL